MKKRKTKQHTEEKAVHKVTAAERTAIEKYRARTAAKQPIRYKVFNNGSDVQIRLDHPDALVGRAVLMDALGSADWDFVYGIVNQFITVSRHDQGIDERKLNFLLSVVEGIEPRDQPRREVHRSCYAAEVPGVDIKGRANVRQQLSAFACSLD
jgi:hypothetical protein